MVDAATDKNDLVPHLDAIAPSIGVLSVGEKRFLLAIYQFYKNQALCDFCHQHKHNLKAPSPSDLSFLDDDHRQVITQLLHTYTGW